MSMKNSKAVPTERMSMLPPVPLVIPKVVVPPSAAPTWLDKVTGVVKSVDDSLNNVLGGTPSDNPYVSSLGKLAMLTGVGLSLSGNADAGRVVSSLGALGSGLVSQEELKAIASSKDPSEAASKMVLKKTLESVATDLGEFKDDWKASMAKHGPRGKIKKSVVVNKSLGPNGFLVNTTDATKKIGLLSEFSDSQIAKALEKFEFNSDMSNHITKQINDYRSQKANRSVGISSSYHNQGSM